jgi:hypothetical protein
MTDNTVYTIGTILPMFKMITSNTKALIFSNTIISRQDRILACTGSPCPTSSYDSICSFKKQKEFISFLDRAWLPNHNFYCEIVDWLYQTSCWCRHYIQTRQEAIKGTNNISFSLR